MTDPAALAALDFIPQLLCDIASCDAFAVGAWTTCCPECRHQTTALYCDDCHRLLTRALDFRLTGSVWRCKACKASFRADSVDLGDVLTWRRL